MSQGFDIPLLEKTLTHVEAVKRSLVRSPSISKSFYGTKSPQLLPNDYSGRAI